MFACVDEFEVAEYIMLRYDLDVLHGTGRRGVIKEQVVCCL